MNEAELKANIVAHLVKKEILEWAREPCIDGKEKCHECVDNLLKRFEDDVFVENHEGGENGSKHN